MVYFKKKDQKKLQSVIKKLEGLGEKLEVRLPGPKGPLNNRDKAFLEAAARRWVFMNNIILEKHHGRFHHLPSDVQQEFREVDEVYKKAEKKVGNPTRATILAVEIAKAMKDTIKLVGI